MQSNTSREKVDMVEKEKAVGEKVRSTSHRKWTFFSNVDMWKIRFGDTSKYYAEKDT